MAGDAPTTTPSPHCCEADRLLVHALDGASKAIALAEVYEAALRKIAASDFIEGEYPIRVAKEALAHGR